jgi:hypothetical protein
MNRPDVIVPFAAIAVLLFTVIVTYLRQSRNRVLEEIVERGELGSMATFRGTLAVQENRSGFLRLTKDSKGQRLQFLYRWIIGLGRQAVVDEVTFDASLQSVELSRNNEKKSVAFSDFSAIRMREAAASHRIRTQVSLWHVELIRVKGSGLLILSSERGNRQRAFEETAAVARAISMIMYRPVQVVVDGNVWTPGWPPKNRPSFS